MAVVRHSSAVQDSSDRDTWVGCPGIAGVAQSVAQLSCNLPKPVTSSIRPMLAGVLLSVNLAFRWLFVRLMFRRIQQSAHTTAHTQEVDQDQLSKAHM